MTKLLAFSAAGFALLLGACASGAQDLGVAHQASLTAVGPDSELGPGVTQSYYAKLQRYTAERVRYPLRSIDANEQGVAIVDVHFQRDGSILVTSLVQSTGYPQLDQEALSVFNRIGSFPPVPAGEASGAEPLLLKMPIVFRLMPG